MIMETNVKNVKCDYLLSVFSLNNEGKDVVHHIHFYEKTQEEIDAIAKSYRSRSSHTVCVYRLETVY